MTKDSTILTAGDIAERWGVALNTVLRMHARGDMPDAFNRHAVKRSYRWHIEAIEAFERQAGAA